MGSKNSTCEPYDFAQETFMEMAGPLAEVEASTTWREALRATYRCGCPADTPCYHEYEAWEMVLCNPDGRDALRLLSSMFLGYYRNGVSGDFLSRHMKARTARRGRKKSASKKGAA